MLDWSYKADKGSKNLFIKLSNTELEKYYKSYLRISGKKEHDHEPYRDMLQEYEEKIESDDSSKIAKAICKTHMLDEIAHRFFKIIHLNHEIWDWEK